MTSHLQEAGVSMLLGNTYHLMLRPGAGRIRDLGGLRRFMNWPGPVLTDSGGFQIFSLKGLSKVTEEGPSSAAMLTAAATNSRRKAR